MKQHDGKKKKEKRDLLSHMFMSDEALSCHNASVVRLAREKQRIKKVDLFN